MSEAGAGDRRVVVVTGGGNGIGAAIAERLGRNGDFVVTVDPMVTLDGAEQLPDAEETTADRIIAAGGAARASNLSVTDRDGVRELFESLRAEHGRLDAVVNVAGITRPTTFTTGSERDWTDVLSVHLDGYRNVLDAALPIMAEAGRGRILGVTSGSGWRPADTGAYGCAKRAVASLTWQLGRLTPPGVVLNAISPIAVTRMVTAALGAGRGGGRAPSSKTGGLSLGGLPAPEEIGPLGAHLLGDDVAWCRSQVIFAGGSEVAVIDPPRLLEVLHAGSLSPLPAILAALGETALVPAEAEQRTGGGSNPRFAPVYSDPPLGGVAAAEGQYLVVSDRPPLAGAVRTELDGRGAKAVTVVDPTIAGRGFAGTAEALQGAVERDGAPDAVVLALAGTPAPSGSGWEEVLASHEGVVEGIAADAAWMRAVVDHAAAVQRPVRIVTITDATTAGGRSRAQAVAQLARAARGATDDRVLVMPVSLEAGDEAATQTAVLAAHLVASAGAAGLSGAELVAGPGWIGLRSHPRPSASFTFEGTEIPEWFDDALRSVVGATPPGRPA